MKATCACGCGAQPVRGEFCPGHDAKKLAEITRRAGGWRKLEALVEAWEKTQ